ncbi:AlpA family transcriptional regulator [Salinisphaera sp. LB1]|uniref:helix-turn-helix transcriptional regulator n=1 Tax=Salinisphaera sp. LB1 TaxID=2183911 RepID=UPI000D708CC8|nr:hypothetical protein [Salinisphaera sp. LB1]AWN17695.1 hypothetical protein SALB1_3501 [Salinisphaera sp. LB1]
MSDNFQPPEIVTADDVAEIMRVKRKTVLNHVQYREGFPKPLNGCKRPLLFDKRAVYDWLYSNQ